MDFLKLSHTFLNSCNVYNILANLNEIECVLYTHNYSIFCLSSMDLITNHCTNRPNFLNINFINPKDNVLGSVCPSVHLPATTPDGTSSFEQGHHNIAEATNLQLLLLLLLKAVFGHHISLSMVHFILMSLSRYFLHHRIICN